MKKFTTDEIGAVAGKVWGALSAEKEQSVAALAKALEEDKEDVAAAIGWLLREDKIAVTFDKKGTGKVSLK